MRHHERRSETPQATRRAQRLLAKDVEYRAAQPTALQKILEILNKAAAIYNKDKMLEK